MKPLPYLIYLSILFTPYLSFAQQQASKFGDISEQELAMKVYPADSSASAVVLSDRGYTRFTYNQTMGIKLEFKRTTRIKILSSEGYDYANVEVPLYKDGKEKESISGIKGYTYNLIDGKLKREKLKNSSEYIERYSEHYDIAKFAMPAVQAGSVLEYEYTISSDFLFNLQDWEFQKDIPVVWSEYEVSIPEYFNYKQFVKGYHPLELHETGQQPGSFNFTHKSRGQQNYVSSTNYENESLRFTEFTQRWAAKDVPALYEEPYITTMNDYVMKVSFELASIQFPGETTKVFTRSWEDIDRELMDEESFGGIINKKANVKKLAEELTAGTTEDLKKLAIIYAHMRDRVHWDGSSSLYASQSSKKTLEEGSGNSADINLNLIAMLRSLDIDAQAVALSTRDHGMMISSYPMLKQYNYVIAQVNIEGESILLDATEKACPFNLLPVRCLNGQGRVVSSTNGKRWVELTDEVKGDSRMMTVVNVSFNESNQIEANIKLSAKDYQALRLRQKYYHQEEKRKTDLTQNNSGWSITHYEPKKWDNLLESLEEDITITSSDGVLQAGELIYFSPILIDQIDENPFKLKQRTYPVDYAYESKIMYMMNFTLPNGYEVEELPEELILTLPDNSARFVYQVKQIGQIVQLVNKLEINKSRFNAQEYPHLREFYNLIVAKQAEQLVLRKQHKSE